MPHTRVAISNHRITDISDSHVSFRWRDYNDHGPEKTMTITVDEFICRFLLHVLPVGLSLHPLLTAFRNSLPRRELDLIRRLLGVTVLPTKSTRALLNGQPDTEVLTGLPTDRCPKCLNGRIAHHRDHPERVSICRVVSDCPEPTRRASSTDPPRPT
ncbi:MAG: transposase [Blastocatellia bacterium]|nr:transposase [Blastocatellia bacterium]